jgi:hypothetical protein
MLQVQNKAEKGLTNVNMVSLAVSLLCDGPVPYQMCLAPGAEQKPLLRHGRSSSQLMAVAMCYYQVHPPPLDIVNGRKAVNLENEVTP